ncbi:hypothetical protein [Haloferula sp. BvORR071]|uniref:hypothetical protein n=1 Tax=Haloferula sp. BvORR071 TaxID=1396141 RepID=UPI002240FC3F|nr:hypothetical protein [Haloferula sp. BvORR071]
MKTTRLAAIAAAIVAPLSMAGLAHGQVSDPLIPVGTLTAFPTLVQTGTHPTLTWSMMHPSKVIGSLGGNGNGNGNNTTGTDTAAVVNPPGTIIPSQDVYVTVQIIGTGPTTCSNTPNYTPPATDLRLSVDGSTFVQLFYGTQAAVNSSQKLYIKKLRAGQRLDLGGRFVQGSGWSNFYTTKSANLQVVSLVNGDLLPVGSSFSASNMASYLKPYFDTTNRAKIGPLSVLVLFELGQTNHSQPCFDYQDQAVLLTFSRNHPNNGHGNNLDGVDSSNPGQGKGGPNGAVDPSGGVDDEIR